MRFPERLPQEFGEAVKNFLQVLDLSISRVAPFADLHPEQLRRLGADETHFTLKPVKIDSLLEAVTLAGGTLTDEEKDFWEKHLKVASFYTMLITKARQRTGGEFPETKEDYMFVWDTAYNMVARSRFKLYMREGEGFDFYAEAISWFSEWKD